MKHTNKKGFTIVELVIVIAVIAILAAVLIPTFSNLIKKANQSSDIQAARQMNTVLAAEQGLGDDIDRVIDVLVENGYNANGLTPVTANHKFFYVVEYERIVLIDEKKGEVVFPKEITITEESVKYDLAGGVKYIDVLAGDVDSLANAFVTGSQTITLNANVVTNKNLEIVKGAEVSLDLNNNKISAVLVDGVKHNNVLNTSGKLTITNGTVESRNVMVYGGGELIVGNGAKIKALDSDGGACIWVYADATVTINEGATLETESFTYAIKNNGGTVNINGGTVVSTRGAISADAGVFNIYGGTFTAGGSEGGHVLYTYEGVINVYGGTFTGTLSGTAETLVIMGGTFSVDPSAYVDAAAYNVTANADGTWTVTAK